MSEQSSALSKGTKTAYATLDDWIRHEAIPFDVSSSDTLNVAVDALMASLDSSVELLGFGEALHGGENLLILRNRLFQRLVETHGYSAIAVESSFPKGRAVNEYIAGRSADSYDDVREKGFSHGFGALEANRELVEWMHSYNADPAHPIKLQFYGFDSPTEMTGTDSPRQLLDFVLDYLIEMDSSSGQGYRQRIDTLVADDSRWENPAAMMDPSQSVGLSPEANALRLETEELITELSIHRPQWTAQSGGERFLEALHAASLARQLLTYHAGLAKPSTDRVSRLLGIRDAMMADNLAYLVSRERSRGKVLVFAHNNHLQRGRTQWQLGPDLHIWWPVGAHLDAMFGERYVVIGSGLGSSDDNGIGQPEAGTLEAHLTAADGSARFIPTHRGQHLPADALAALPVRSGSMRNFSYFPFTPDTFTHFDWLVVLDSTPYNRGGVPLPPVPST
jgi:erythromycin esterase